MWLLYCFIFFPVVQKDNKIVIYYIKPIKIMNDAVISNYIHT